MPKTATHTSDHDLRRDTHVHPVDWTNPTPEGPYNLVVIGAGTAGLVTASAAAGLGAKVALIERERMGGDCLNVGCVPSKALLACARRAAAVRDAKHFGVTGTENAHTDFEAVMERMRRLRADIAPADSAERFRDMGVDVYFGRAEFTGADRLRVNDHILRFKKAAICTGARPAVPAIPGLEDIPYLTNETVFSLTRLPSRLGIIGAGPIGCELAQAFARFGSEVHLFESGHGVLPREDPEAAQVVQTALEQDGVRLHCCGKDLRIDRVGNDIHMRVQSHGTAVDQKVDQVLVATGRAPNIDSLNLPAAGVEPGEHGVRVDARLRTTNPRVYAAGDVCSPQRFTHAADAMARNLVRNALFFGRAKTEHLVIPHCTYTEPEVAQVGLTETEARGRGIAIDTFTRRSQEVDRALLEGETDGWVRVVVKQGGDRILGATAVGAQAGELVSRFSHAMTQNLGLSTFADVVFPYPTRAEAVKHLADAYNRTRLTPWMKRLLTRFFTWRR